MPMSGLEAPVNRRRAVTHMSLRNQVLAVAIGVGTPADSQSHPPYHRRSGFGASLSKQVSDPEEPGGAPYVSKEDDPGLRLCQPEFRLRVACSHDRFGAGRRDRFRRPLARSG